MKYSRSPVGTAMSGRAYLKLAPANAVASLNVVREQTEAPQIRATPGSIRTTTMSFATIHEHGDLLVRYLRARREIFIDRLHWNLPEADGMEFDQYDTPFCRWVILHEFGEVVAGVRLMSTTAQCGVYTYMLRDAQNGLLEGIPTDALFLPAPVNPVIWEASRFFISDAIPAARRGTVQRQLFQSMKLAAKENGAVSIIGIVPAVWSRWARRLDADATQIGAKFAIDGTWSQSVQFCVNGLPMKNG